MRRLLGNLKLGHVLLVVAVAVGATVALVSVGSSVVIPGGGPTKSDCYVSLKLPSVTTALVAKPKNKELDCMDGDPTCDSDGQCNNVCAMQAQLCINQSGILDCTPPTGGLKKLTFKSHPVSFVFQGPAALTSSACGSLLDLNVPVKVKPNGKKLPGKLSVNATAIGVKGTKPAKDGDTYIIKCLPRVGACPTTTTSTVTTTTTTSTTVPLCGDGFVGGTEQCDPPGQQGQCGANQFCGIDCQCAATTACACGTPTPTKLKFTTSVNQLTCGQATDSNNVSVRDLPCGTLWFGGGHVGTQLPNLQPDMGVSFEKVTGCSGTVFGLAKTTSTDTGSTRTCTSQGCTFGAPLPVPNDAVSSISTCVQNVVAQDAVGFGECATGAINVNLPLTSRLYLTGDLLPDDPNLPYTTGIQPCPVCADGGDGLKCHGGPNDGNACTPETSNLGVAYPTSQDCPPDEANFLGTLSVPFALTTGTSQKIAVTLDGQENAFCGFCRDADDTGAFQNPAVPCTSNGDCTDPVFEGCQQKDGGAFDRTTAAKITETGTPAGDMRDGSGHGATLVSVFCLPPSFSPLVDPAAGLPGPGATALPGTAQLLSSPSGAFVQE